MRAVPRDGRPRTRTPAWGRGRSRRRRPRRAGRVGRSRASKRPPRAPDARRRCEMHVWSRNRKWPAPRPTAPMHAHHSAHGDLMVARYKEYPTVSCFLVVAGNSYTTRYADTTHPRRTPLANRNTRSAGALSLFHICGLRSLWALPWRVRSAFHISRREGRVRGLCVNTESGV